MGKIYMELKIRQKSRTIFGIQQPSPASSLEDDVVLADNQTIADVNQYASSRINKPAQAIMSAKLKNIIHIRPDFYLSEPSTSNLEEDPISIAALDTDSVMPEVSMSLIDENARTQKQLKQDTQSKEILSGEQQYSSDRKQSSIVQQPQKSNLDSTPQQPSTQPSRIPRLKTPWRSPRGKVHPQSTSIRSMPEMQHSTSRSAFQSPGMCVSYSDL